MAMALAERTRACGMAPRGGIYHRGWADGGTRPKLEEGVAEMEGGNRRASDAPGRSPETSVRRRDVWREGCAAGWAAARRPWPCCDGALAHVERSGEKADAAEILRLKGELLLARDGLPAREAERCMRAAIELAREQQARWWELRATVSVARLLARQGHRNEARAMLADIYGWFTEGFDTADLKDAKGAARGTRWLVRYFARNANPCD